MYKQIFYALVTTALLLSHNALPNSLDELITVEVPFAFRVAGKTLPAGKYVVQREPQMPQVLHIQSREQRLTVLVYARAIELAQPVAKGALKFKGYGDQRFLSEIHAVGRGVKYELTPTKDESRLAKAMKAKDISALPHGSPMQR